MNAPQKRPIIRKKISANATEVPTQEVSLEIPSANATEVPHQEVSLEIPSTNEVSDSPEPQVSVTPAARKRRVVTPESCR